MISCDDLQTSSSYSSNDTSYSSGSMSNRTPKKATSASSALFSTTELMQKDLKRDFDGHTYDQVTVAEFVEHVWKLDLATMKRITEAKLQLLQDPLTRYQDVLTPGKNFKEVNLHEPLRQMARGLLKDVCDILSIEHSKLVTYFWDGAGMVTFRSEDKDTSKARIRKPDMLEVYIPLTEDGLPSLDPDESPLPSNALKPAWRDVRASVEFKKKKIEDGVRRTSPDLPSIPEHRVSAEAKELNPAGGSESTSTTGTGRRPRRNTRPRNSRRQTPTNPSDSRASSVESVDTGSKRSASSLTDDNRPTKRARINVSMDEMQLATYALECLFVGNRHYTTGIFIDGFFIKLWYYDRSAVMCTEAFNFSTPSGTIDLALVLFTLGQCNMQQAGFDPYLHQITLPNNGQFIEPQSVTPLLRPHSDDTQLCYKFPDPTSPNDRVFTVHKTISQYKGIIGRGTTAIVGKLGSVGGVLSDNLHVLKMSWQYSTRRHEGDIIQHLRKALPAWIDHLPDPVFYTTVSGDDLGLPSRTMRRILEESNRTSLDSKNDRDLHVIVTNRFKNIWQAKDVDEFKRIFLDCLECHYHTYHTGRVIHRDISENNLMIYQPGVTDKDDNKDSDNSDHDSDPKESVEVEGSSSPPPPAARGILNDFDMAAVLNPDGGIDLASTPHHHLTGTLPFMAVDLLEPSRPQNPLDSSNIHHYRYDLESFYYFLIWATILYDLKAGRRVAPKEKSLLYRWSKGDEISAYHAKVSLHSRDFEKYAADVRPEWKDVWDTWVVPLSNMFIDGMQAQTNAARRKVASFDHATCDGHITFEKFMSAIGETERGLTKQAS
ncbi:hypothetical protein JR316_0003933 [Psilocybe cubensis]|uniref:Fungal-type protein kinase domain-containing protein n=2 Tax=Psilocybe cubensis TaxID=181762 RepID=A0A8H7Y1N3_PSICU|nr:hypothetical protein JR316_0003933 [Psilocybe cubensis]KAH9484451.1 hypothetical protein JR316_0003933 [Psilocybe cubensis]